ncbi:MAG TPA: hypothetical protein VHD87_12720 [Acidimicrobiales bacterium]|nr:hypothetical protein [Acidimicrobiales bacterium]
MGLYEMSSGKLTPVASTTFAVEQILERRDLQAALRDNIAALGDDLLVVAEEFGGFADANRRIDLLCVDRDAHLVVVELKRTEDGGHLELQALRYAAMVSAMTFDDLVDVYARHLGVQGEDNDARAALADWLDDAGGEDAVLQREVRIVLASQNFDKQITTTVLWLNDVFGMDIRCIRLTPYSFEGKLLLDVQPVIPLPEAEELTVKLKRRTTAARAASESTKDLTKYVVSTPTGSTGPLPKRRAAIELVRALHAAGVPAAVLKTKIQNRRFLGVPGVLSGEELEAAFVERYPKAAAALHRWWLDAPLHDADETYVLSNQWGRMFLPTVEALLSLAPDAGITVEPAS